MRMRRNALFALPLALAAFGPVAAGAAGRGGLNESPAPAATSPGGAWGTFAYVDVLRPHGRARGDAAEQAATRACDGGNSDRIGGSAFDACMLARGWRFGSFEPTPAGAYLYDDVRKPHGLERNDAARQTATRACDAGKPGNIGTRKFDACMLARGWRFAGRAPEAPSADLSWSWSEPSPPAETPSSDDSANQAIQMMNQQMATDAANAAAQQQFLDGMAAAQQIENNANFMQQ